MSVHKFLTPFAITGDKAAIPVSIQTDGSVSYSEGWSYDYSRNPNTDPQAKRIDRAATNQLMYDITSALGQLQTQGAPEWITAAENGGSAYPYSAGSVVRYGSSLYLSLTDANIATPGTDVTKWTVVTGHANIWTAADTGTANTCTATLSPAPTAYAATQVVVLKVVNTNTGAATFNANGLGAKAIKKVSSGALVDLSAGDLQAGGFAILAYDGTQFVLANQGVTWANQNANVVFAGPASGGAAAPGFRALTLQDIPSGTGIDPIIGMSRNARMSITAAAAAATLTADEVVVGTALGGMAKKLSSYNKTVNLATTGAGGMDTGAAPTSGYVSVYAIAKADGTTSVLACAVATSSGAVYSGANMPAGYTLSALLAIWPTTGAGLLSVGQLIDRRVWIATTSNLSGGTATSYTAVTMSVPAAAKTVIAQLGATYSNNSVDAYLASDSAGVIYVQQSPQSASAGNTPRLVAELPLITAQTLYYKMGGSTTTSASVSTLGYTF